MPRRPRLVVPDIPLHIIQRGNNRQNCFFANSDYMVYLDLLQRSSASARCPIHAYVLMSNHVHILASPSSEDAAAQMMKSVGERYVQYVNQTYGRFGTLWQGRFRSCLVQDEIYLLVCHKYIELNPVRAGIVTHPSLYRWSSYSSNAHGEKDDVLSPHPLFSQLGEDDAARRHAYRELFNGSLSDDHVAAVRDATNYNYAFGSTEFAETMGDALGRPVTRRITAPRHIRS